MKKRVSREEYLAELNRELQNDPYYVEGMEWRLTPTGLHMEGAEKHAYWAGVYARSRARVEERFEAI